MSDWSVAWARITLSEGVVSMEVGGQIIGPGPGVWESAEPPSGEEG